MELRSSSQIDNYEYEELKTTLYNWGFYEEGMELQEMRQMVGALQQSVSEDFTDMDMERAIRESEMDFMPLNDDGVFNSTMSVGNSPCISPEMPSQFMIVEADVHHPLDWSPAYSEEVRLRRKRLATISPNREDHIILQQRQRLSDHYEITESIQYSPEEKQTLSLNDSINTIGSEDISLLCNQFLYESNSNDSYEVVGPISLRRPTNDSGVNFVSDAPERSASPSHSYATLPSPITISSASSPSSLNNDIDILGPVSLRRPANDSGVNSLNENSNISYSSWDMHISSHSLYNNDNDNVVENYSFEPAPANLTNPSYENPRSTQYFGSNQNIGKTLADVVNDETEFLPICIDYFTDDEDFENSQPSL